MLFTINLHVKKIIKIFNLIKFIDQWLLMKRLKNLQRKYTYSKFNILIQILSFV
jgi:hypothetical protein